MSDMISLIRTVHDEMRWHRQPPSQKEGSRRMLNRVREEMANSRTPIAELSAGQGLLRDFGDATDIVRLRELLEHRSDLDEQVVDMTGETIRRLQEKENLRDEIAREETIRLRLMTPYPRKQDSRFIAIRRGKIVAEAADSSSVSVAIVRKRQTNRSYHAMVLSVDELNDFKLEGILVSSEAELWEAVHNKSFSPSARLNALDELIARGDTDVPAFAVTELERADRGGEWRAGLLVVTERVIVRDRELRTRLTRTLLAHARALGRELLLPPACGEKRDEQALWAALRRYATLVSADETGTLLEFLATSARLTHQVVFQCIANVFSVTPPKNGARLDPLRAKVSALAVEYLSQSTPITGEQVSLSLSAFVAAAALGSTDMEQLEHLLAEHERWLVDTAADRLRALVEAWKTVVGGADTTAFRAVAKSLLRLSSAPT